MTVMDAITQLQAIKPNQYDDETVIRWLSDLDGMLYREVVRDHENSEDIAHGPYDPEADMDTELMVQAPYSDIYIKYLSAQVDFNNAEYQRFNNSMVMFNMAFMAFADWYNRNNLPLQKHYVRT